MIYDVQHWTATDAMKVVISSSLEGEEVVVKRWVVACLDLQARAQRPVRRQEFDSEEFDSEEPNARNNHHAGSSWGRVSCGFLERVRVCHCPMLIQDQQ